MHFSRISIPDGENASQGVDEGVDLEGGTGEAVARCNQGVDLSRTKYPTGETDGAPREGGGRQDLGQ